MSGSESRFATATDVVRAAARGSISRELMSTPRSWTYQPHYKTTRLADDWEERSNSFDAAEHAFIADLIDVHDYELIIWLLDDDGEQGR